MPKHQRPWCGRCSLQTHRSRSACSSSVERYTFLSSAMPARCPPWLSPANAGEGTAATVRSAAPSPSASNTAFVISSTNSGIRQCRVASLPSSMAYPARYPIERFQVFQTAIDRAACDPGRPRHRAHAPVSGGMRLGRRKQAPFVLINPGRIESLSVMRVLASTAIT